MWKNTFWHWNGKVKVSVDTEDDKHVKLQGNQYMRRCGSNKHQMWQKVCRSIQKKTGFVITRCSQSPEIIPFVSSDLLSHFIIEHIHYPDSAHSMLGSEYANELVSFSTSAQNYVLLEWSCLPFRAEYHRFNQINSALILQGSTLTWFPIRCEGDSQRNRAKNCITRKPLTWCIIEILTLKWLLFKMCLNIDVEKFSFVEGAFLLLNLL